jgi:hypothetical protein
MNGMQKSITGRLLCLALASVTPFVVLTPAAVADYTQPGFDGIMCDSDMECEEATGYPYDVAVTMGADAPKYPRLVGHGCKGANGPIYAFEEDHFPVSDHGGAACREIVPMDWEWRK